MLRVSDVWERALHTPGVAVAKPGEVIDRSDVTTVAVVARTDPQEQPSVVTLSVPEHLAEPDDFPVARQAHDYI
jgi:hypothetical protein